MLSIADFMYIDNEKYPKILLLWFVIISFIILFLIGMNHFMHFNHYHKYEGIVKNGYVSIYVSLNELDSIVNNNYVYIDDTQYAYTIIDIKKDVISNNDSYYQEVWLDVNISDKTLVNNRLIEVKFILDRESVFSYFLNFIKGEYDD